jgi:hypothetical protein
MYLCALGVTKAAAPGTAALNFSRGKYIGLGILRHPQQSLRESRYLQQKTEFQDGHIETIP